MTFRFDLLLAWLSLASCMSAQQPSNSPASSQGSEVSTIHVSARIALLDATVIDSKGEPVTGLTAKDFAVYEDNKPQPIVSFEAAGSHALPAPTVSAPETLDPARPVTFGQSPVTILVLDEINTHFSDATYGVRQVRSYLESQPKVLKQPVAMFVVNDSRFAMMHDYTLDRDALIAALEQHKTVYAWKLEQSMSVGQGVAERLDASVSAMERIAENSARLPVHKNMIWVGGGFPSIDPNSLTPTTEQTLRLTLQHVTDVLMDTRVSLYAVDPTSSAAGMTEITDETQAAFVMYAAEGAGRAIDPFDLSLAFDNLAPTTGGRVVRAMNDIAHQVDQSVRVGGAFYTLGYHPTDELKSVQQYRAIRVVCLRPGTAVIARRGFYTSSLPTVAARDTVIYDLNNAAESDVPLTGLSLHIVGGAPSFTVQVRANGLSWHEVEGGGHAAQVQVLAVGLSAKKKIVGHRLQSMTANASPLADVGSPEKEASFAIAFEPPKNAVLLRFVVRDVATGHMGTFDIPTGKP